MTTSDVRMRAREAADSVIASAKRLADRVGSPGVNITVHIDRVIINPIDEIEDLVRAVITEAEERIMTVLDQLRAAQAETKTLLGTVAATIDEIRTDLSDLLARLANSAPGSQEVLDATAEATEIKDRMAAAVAALRGAADLYTPGGPTPVALSLTCPVVAPVAAAAGEAVAAVTFGDPVPSGGQAPYSVALSHQSGGPFPVGDTTVTATVTDGAGASASCSFVVTVTGEVVEP